MNFKNLTDLCNFLAIGLNKIQIKKIFKNIDEEKKGYFIQSELLDST